VEVLRIWSGKLLTIAILFLAAFVLFISPIVKHNRAKPLRQHLRQKNTGRYKSTEMKMKKKSVSEWVKSGDPCGVAKFAGAVRRFQSSWRGLVCYYWLAVRGLGHILVLRKTLWSLIYAFAGWTEYNIRGGERVESVEVICLARCVERELMIPDKHQLMQPLLWWKRVTVMCTVSDFVGNRWVPYGKTQRPEMLFTRARELG